MNEVAEHFGTRENQDEGTEFGMWVFLATELMFFGPLLLGYAYARHQDPAGFAEASRHTDLVIGSLNTAVLLTSAMVMSFAIRSARLLQRRSLLVYLSIAALLGLLFLALKGYEYHDDIDQNLVPWLDFHFPAAYRSAGMLFFYEYFALTALHAFHLSVAICVVVVYLVRIALADRHGPQGIARFRQQIAVAGLYWHFVDGMWVLLFTLIYVVGPR